MKENENLISSYTETLFLNKYSRFRDMNFLFKQAEEIMNIYNLYILYIHILNTYTSFLYTIKN